VFFRLFLCFGVVNGKGPFSFPSLIIHSIKRLKEHISLKNLNLMVLKKLWISRHAFCYIIDDGIFPINLYFAYGRG